MKIQKKKLQKNITKNNILILYNDKIEHFIKSKYFYELPLEQFKNENPIFSKFYEVKLLFENFLVKECKIPKDNFDYRGNLINQNLKNNIIRGKEIYFPPYGWYCLGLNVIGKYDNGDDKWINDNTEKSEWAIAYHGINSKEVEKILNKIILDNGISEAVNERMAQLNDIRHSGKVGRGIFLTPNISVTERYTGKIFFNNKNYKILLMAKVKSEKIRQPENSQFWILDQEYIRDYRILLKEIN